MRYPIRRGFWAPLLAVLGGTRGASYVEVGDDGVRVRFGPGFDLTVERRDIADAYRRAWPLLGGVGWRIGGKTVGLIGSYAGVVEVELREVRRARVFGLPYSFRRIAVSLEDPEGFLDELRRRDGRPPPPASLAAEQTRGPPASVRDRR